MDYTAFFLGVTLFADGYDMRMFSPVQNILPSFLPSSTTVQYESYYTYRPSDAVAGRASHGVDVHAGQSDGPRGLPARQPAGLRGPLASLLAGGGHLRPAATNQN